MNRLLLCQVKIHLIQINCKSKQKKNKIFYDLPFFPKSYQDTYHFLSLSLFYSWFDLVEVILCFIFCGEILVRLYVAPLWCKSPRSNTYRNEHGSYNAKYHPNNKYGQPIHPSASSSSSPSSTATNNRDQKEIGHNDLEIPFFKDFINYMDIISVIPTFIEAADLFEPLPLIPGKMTSSQIVISLLKGTRALRLYKIFRAHPGTKILIQTMHGSSVGLICSFEP